MCGFAGFYGQGENRNEILGEMLETIIHRGPDSEGRYLDEKVALGFRRLSIVDLSEHGNQPMFNEDESLVLTFNGEIYNYKELLLELLAAGHTFHSHTDSEVLLHGYEEWGTELVTKLRGMFAFVIWDKKKEQLFGARDMFGIKPFYYSKMENVFLFGSEIKSLMKHFLKMCSAFLRRIILFMMEKNAKRSAIIVLTFRQTVPGVIHRC